MPPKEKAPSAKDKRKAAKEAEKAMKESVEACQEGEVILDKINVDKNIGIAQFPKAVVHFTKAIELNPGNSQAYLLRAKCMKGMGDFDKAAQDYTKALEVQPHDYDALSCRAYCHEQLEQWDAAIADYSAVIELLPDDDHAYNMRGYCRAAKRAPGLRLKAVEYKHVMSDLTKAIELNPCNYFAHANRGNVQFDRQNYTKAIEDYSRALFTKDDYWYVYSRRGLAYFECVRAERTPSAAGERDEVDDEEAAKAKAEAAKKKTQEEVWEEEFWAEERNLRRQEQHESFLTQAVKDFTVFLKHSEKESGELDPATLLYRAHAYLMQRNLDDSLKDFKKVKELDPSLAPVVEPKIDAIREQTGVKALVHAE